MGMILSRKLKKHKFALDNAESYEEWCDLAVVYDDLSGASTWRREERSSKYDYQQIRHRLDRLRELKSRHDHHGLLFTLNEGVHGNMGGMGKAELYSRSLVGTKHLIEDYVKEIADSIELIASLDDDEISFEEKYDFFHRASLCYGRSALMLSGGGTLGHFHLGVIKALMQQDLMPRVLSGASAGAVVSAIFGTHRRNDVVSYVSEENLIAEGERLLGKDVTQYETDEVEASINRLIPDLTFQEAYELTGHYINISIAPAELHQTSRLLNAITSPNVYVREAIRASCAIPGVYPPVTLQAKNALGERQPYLPQRKWVDGSVSDDLPAKRLSRLYGVNHYIGSLINPIVAFRDEAKVENRGLTDRAKILSHKGMVVWVKNFNKLVQKYGQDYPKLSLYANMAHSVLKQDYNVDITLYPDFKSIPLKKLISPLESHELLTLLRQGEMSAWRNMGRIRVSSTISHVLDDVIERYEDKIIHRSPHRRRVFMKSVDS